MESTREKTIRSIRELVSTKLSGIPARVYLIGSTARGDAEPHSDIDIAVEALDSTPSTLIMDLRVALEQSTVPFFVDVFDFAKLNAHYRNQIKQEGIVWIEPNEG